MATAGMATAIGDITGMKAVENLSTAKWMDIEKRLRTAILAHEVQAPSLEELSRSLGRSMRFLKDYVEANDCFMLNVAVLTGNGIGHLPLDSMTVEYTGACSAGDSGDEMPISVRSCNHAGVTITESGTWFTEHSREPRGKWSHEGTPGDYSSTLMVYCDRCGLARNYSRKRLPKWLRVFLDELDI